MSEPIIKPPLGGLTAHQLDRQRCEAPGCKEDHGALFLNARCHTGQGMEVEYCSGVLTVRCNVCKAHVARIAVASGGPS